MNLIINGEARECRVRTIRELVEIELEADDVPARGVAVAVNGRVVPRAGWHEAALAPGDKIEIVRALPGG